MPPAPHGTRLGAGSHSDCHEMTNWLISNLLNAFMLITKKQKAAVEQLSLQEEEEGATRIFMPLCYGGGDEAQGAAPKDKAYMPAPWPPLPAPPVHW